MKKFLIGFLCLIMVISQLPIALQAQTADDIEVISNTVSNALNAGVSDSLIVDTTGGALSTATGKKTYKNTQITSLALLNDGVCASLVDDDWHWLSASSEFYSEVTAVDSFVYSANNWYADTVPQIVYNIVPETKVTFKIVLRKEFADWNDAVIEISDDSQNYYIPSENYLTYTTKEYECSNYGTMSVRFYELTAPVYGTLRISLPTAQSIMDRTTSDINSDSSAFVTASALLIPASSTETDIKYIESGKIDSIPDNISGWKSSVSTEYGSFSGGTYVRNINLTSGWAWGNANGNPAYLIPELAYEKTFTLDSNNQFKLTYNVAAGTTFVLPVVMKSILWEKLDEENNIDFQIDDSSGLAVITPQYIETVSKWSENSDIDIVMRKYSVYCSRSSIITVTISKEVMAKLLTAVLTMNSAATYMEYSALVYPAYGFGKLTEDIVENNGVGTNIHDNLYYRSNAISSDAYAFSGGIAVSKVTTDWHWWLEDTRFFDMVASADEYVYTTAYDKDISPQLYYMFEESTTAAFKVGITEGVADWDDVDIEFSKDGTAWENAEVRWLEESFDTLYADGACPMNVRFYEANIPNAGYLKITLPNGKTAADNWNTQINNNKKSLGYCVFTTGVTASDSCFTTGDLDGDGNISGADLVLLRKILLNDRFENCADINSNHLIDIIDLVRLKKTIAEILPENFSLLAPSSDEIMLSSLKPDFSWEESAGSENYTLKIQKFDAFADEFSDVFVIDNITENTYTPDEKQLLEYNEIYRWQVIAYNTAGKYCICTGENGDAWNYFLSKTNTENSSVNSDINFTFDGSVTEEVLCNYLSRSVTMTGALNFLKYADYSAEGMVRKRDILYSGAKYISRAASVWEPTIEEINRLSNQKAYIDFIHEYDPEIVFEACIFENVTEKVEEIPIPEWVFEAFEKTPEERNFDFNSMVRSGNTPDISKEETQMFFYYRACTYIDAGYEALHFGQIVHMTAYDCDDTGKVYYQATTELFNMIRAYAKENARRHFVFINAHTPYGTNLTTNQYDYIGTDGYLLFDFHVFPIRATTEETEAHVATEENPQTQILKVGNSNSIYCRTPGGQTHSGWECESIPYFVELDNAYVGDTDHTLPTPNLDLNWGKDDISWFASQPRSYRHYWLDYAYNWVRSLDDSGYLCMPLYRPATSADVALQGNYYVATHDFFSVSQTALSDISKMRYIWQQSK